MKSSHNCAFGLPFFLFTKSESSSLVFIHCLCTSFTSRCLARYKEAFTAVSGWPKASPVSFAENPKTSVSKIKTTWRVSSTSITHSNVIQLVSKGNMSEQSSAISLYQMSNTKRVLDILIYPGSANRGKSRAAYSPK
jgi:hypothetical protein